MEEKKLTDEEIVKDIERSTGMPSYWKKIVLDLIYRLQDEKQKVVQDYYCEAQHCDVQKDIIEKQKAEIERLNGKYRNLEINYNAVWEEFRKYEIENAELQKQVDELKEKLWKSKQNMMTYHSKTVAEAVKDTQKEILDDLRNIFIEQSSYGSDANQHIGYYDYEVKMGLVIEQIEEYAKEKHGIEYGVEVE